MTHTPDSPLLQLAERCEAASGPDRKLDALIWFRAIEKIEPGDPPRDKDMVGRWPAYTASIDAAMTLVPEGQHVEIGIYRADDDLPEENYVRVSLDVSGDGPRWEDMDRSQAATPALSLCAASLRARATTTGEPR